MRDLTNSKRQTITIRIAPELLKEFQLYCVNEDTSMQHEVIEMIKALVDFKE